MIAVDTNILVRLIVADDERQVGLALALADREVFFVSFTVLIETEWVLRSRYGYDRSAIVAALHALESLIDLDFEHHADVRWAIDRYAIAGELADYLHIAVARPIGRFATFEKKLSKCAGPDAPVAVETLA